MYLETKTKLFQIIQTLLQQSYRTVVVIEKILSWWAISLGFSTVKRVRVRVRYNYTSKYQSIPPIISITVVWFALTEHWFFDLLCLDNFESFPSWTRINQPQEFLIKTIQMPQLSKQWTEIILPSSQQLENKNEW